ASKRFLVIADHTKLVARLGGVPLPVEAVRFAAEVLISRMTSMNVDPRPRLSEGDWWQTDEGHVIIDVGLNGQDCGEVADELRRMAGVVETGYFPTEATEAIIAFPDRIERRTRTR
ncbi:MAG: ribose-5-phosphate isomerase A, partial [Acidobacteriota bacterium]